MDKRVNSIVALNEQRNARLEDPYDPVKGVNAVGERVRVEIIDAPCPVQYVPQSMLHEVPMARDLVQAGSIRAFVRLYDEFATLAYQTARDRVWQRWIYHRSQYDFEFWAITCVVIKDKRSEQDMPFLLNRPQRRVLAAFEAKRLADEPMRFILLKARQWGGSTLVQVYMAWIQLMHRRNWNSVICSHLKDSAAQIKGMYTKLLANYPAWMLGTNEQPAFRPFERTASTSVVANTGCRVTICSSESPEAVRGADAAMAHLSEAAFWTDTPAHTPADLIRAVCGSIALLPYSLVVIESTANGTGGYFHREYMRALRGESDKQALFVPWYEIEMYTVPVDDPAALAASLTPYERTLWEAGATLEGIAWYRAKRREYHDHADMMAEYPSSEVEAFSYTGERVFDARAVQRLRATCCTPMWVGDVAGRAITGSDALRDVDFVEEPGGLMQVWFPPEHDTLMRDRYVVAVDVGGRSQRADYSVIAVFDRGDMPRGGVPAVVAQWRGHTDHDLLAWKAAQIATYYNRALLVVESNTLETECGDDMGAGYILDTLARHYNNLYARHHEGGEIAGRVPVRWGFHMNRATKSLVVNHQINILRTAGYIERDELACHEYDVYERKPNGSYGARDGEHDDILITRCMGIYICCDLPLLRHTPPRRHLPLSAASF